MELNEIHNPSEHASVSLKVVLLVFSLVLIGTLGYLVWDANNTPSTSNADPVPVAKQKKVETSSPAALECGDTAKYGFSMTFGDKWNGYKIKQVLQKDMDPQPGYALVTCYFQMPTLSTEEVWTTASVDHDAKYASLFAVSVYTPAQWLASQEEANKPTKLGETTDYVWGWSQAQALPQDLQDSKISDDIKNVVATFAVVK
jgi:hypothetical protein